MEDKVKRRWGIVAVAILMFFVAMINNLISGQKNSIYYVVWIVVGYYGYKGNLIQIKSLMKFLIALNLLIMLFVNMFASDDMLSYVYRYETKEGLVIGALIMLIPKIALILYCTSKIKKENLENNEIPVMTSVAISSQSKKEISEKNYEEALIEYESADKNKGLYAKLFAENNGNEEAVKLNYIKQRANELAESTKNIDIGTNQNSTTNSASLKLENKSEDKKITNLFDDRTFSNEHLKNKSFYITEKVQPKHGIDVVIAKAIGVIVTFFILGVCGMVLFKYAIN